MNKKIGIIAFTLMLAVIGTANAQQYEPEKNFTVEIGGWGDLRITAYKGNNKNVNIPTQIKKRSVDIIDSGAFSGKKLTGVTIPSSVKEIRGNAFKNNPLTSITIGSNVKEIGEGAFDNGFAQAYEQYGKVAGTYTLSNGKWINKEIEQALATEILITTPNSGDDFDIEQNKQGGITITKYKGTRRAVIIPETIEGVKVTVIGERTFRGNKNILSVTIPDGVTSIADGYDDRRSGGVINGAFSDCANLINITIGNSLTSIGTYAFNGCNNLTNVTIGNGVTNIKLGAFEGCTRLTNINIPNSVTSIGGEAFKDCTSLASVTIGNSVTSIREAAFSGCTSLTNINIPNSVKSIEKETFRNCTSLTGIIIPDSVTAIGEHIFTDCTSLASVTIGNSVTSIGSSAFYGCTSLASINIPDGVKSIGGNTFCSCTSLTSVIIPDSVTNIDYLAFQKCTGLTSVTIGNGITSLDRGTFGYSPITSITIGANKRYANVFPNNFANFYDSQDKKEGTYTWSGRLWSVK